MQEFDTSKYNLQRKEDNTIVRVDGYGNESPEMDVAYYDSQIAFHEQVVANLEAQRDKLSAFETDNPPVESEAPEEPTEPESTEETPQE